MRLLCITPGECNFGSWPPWAHSFSVADHRTSFREPGILSNIGSQCDGFLREFESRGVQSLAPTEGRMSQWSECVAVADAVRQMFRFLAHVVIRQRALEVQA